MQPKPHTAGIVGLVITTLGATLEALRDADVLPLLPHWLSLSVIIAGAVWQGVTKGVAHGGTVLVPREIAEVKGLAKPKNAGGGK